MELRGHTRQPAFGRDTHVEWRGVAVGSRAALLNTPNGGDRPVKPSTGRFSISRICRHLDVGLGYLQASTRIYRHLQPSAAVDRHLPQHLPHPSGAPGDAQGHPSHFPVQLQKPPLVAMTAPQDSLAPATV